MWAAPEQTTAAGEGLQDAINYDFSGSHKPIAKGPSNEQEKNVSLSVGAFALQAK
jgi:hypothetical protein